MLLAVHREVSENALHAFAEATELNGMGAHRKVQTSAKQQNDQNVIGKIRIDG